MGRPLNAHAAKLQNVRICLESTRLSAFFYILPPYLLLSRAQPIQCFDLILYTRFGELDSVCVFSSHSGKGRPEQNWMDCLKDDFQAFGATDGSTVDNRLTFGVDRAVWTLAAKMDDGAPWHKGVLQGAEKFMASWHKEEEEASRRRATKRDSRDLEPPTHL